MTRKATILKELNDAAGLMYGWDEGFHPTGITCGYVGNVYRDGNDDRAWGFFQHRSKSNFSTERMRGRFSTQKELLDHYEANREAYLAWARG